MKGETLLFITLVKFSQGKKTYFVIVALLASCWVPPQLHILIFIFITQFMINILNAFTLLKYHDCCVVQS